MSKVVQLYRGSSMADGEVALSACGAWFCRLYEFNGYQVAHTPWVKIAEPKRPTHTTVSDDMAESYGVREELLTDEQRARVVVGPTGATLRLASGACSNRLPDTQQEAEAREIAKACKGRKPMAKRAARSL